MCGGNCSYCACGFNDDDPRAPELLKATPPFYRERTMELPSTTAPSSESTLVTPEKIATPPRSEVTED